MTCPQFPTVPEIYIGLNLWTYLSSLPKTGVNLHQLHGIQISCGASGFFPLACRAWITPASGESPRVVAAVDLQRTMPPLWDSDGGNHQVPTYLWCLKWGTALCREAMMRPLQADMRKQYHDLVIVCVYMYVCIYIYYPCISCVSILSSVSSQHHACIVS